MTIADHTQRQRALTPTESFIVQAPAGSGKTQLLTQRFLRVLTTVTQPEAILAITFTRKAAAEMRERIIHALQFAAKTPTAPTLAHEYTMWQLAKTVLQHDKQHQWQLMQNPSRLRIMTIDALCAQLTQQAPQLSTLYARQYIAEQPNTYYQQAVATILTDCAQSSPYIDAITTLLTHLDNRIDYVSQLLTGMLACREQWLDIIVGLPNTQQQRTTLEASLQQVIATVLTQANTQLSDKLRCELQQLYGFACQYQPTLTPLNDNWPTPTVENLAIWQGLVSLLLTKQGQWRKQVNKHCGFPAPSTGRDAAEKAALKTHKHAMQAVLAELANAPPYLEQALRAITLCPTPHYTEQQWAVLSALLTLLPVVAAQLRVIFAEKNNIDFTEVSLGALYALHDHQGTTDLALRLDYTLKHILVDEFQDTSITQYRLLQALTAGWQTNDGNTLFLVGDPMQSIYRFRQADVSLFLQAKQHGIGNVTLTYLALTTNFRSQPVIVDWLNQHFACLFPSNEDSQTGAISYSPAVAANVARDQATVISHLVCKQQEHDQQTAHIVHLITQLHKQNPDNDTAILVRSRTQLTPLLSALRTANIAFNAVDIERLDNQRVIQDLVNLTYALCYLADRTAWLSILRAPFCGLTLAMLTELIESHNKPQLLIWDCLQQAPDHIQQHPRFCHIITVLKQWWQTRYQQPLHKTVANIWYALGGPASYTTPDVIAQADAFFALLAKHDNSGTLADRSVFSDALSQLYASAENQHHCRLHIMTLHKAKGLEFDNVILPYLDKTPPALEQPLLRWQRAPSANDDHLLLAPIKAFHDEMDPIYRYLQQCEKKHIDHEIKRLLYVGATRAKQQLHLVGAVQYKSELQSLTPPKSHSLLGVLWEHIDKDNIIHTVPSLTATPSQQPGELTRLADDWYACDSARQLITYCQDLPTTTGLNHPQPTATIESAIGTVIHRCLERIAIDGITAWEQRCFTDYHAYWQQQLLHLHVPKSACKQAIDIIESTLVTTLGDPRGRWILSQDELAFNELKLTACIDDKPTSVILDRTFVAEGYCWIIDYKTAMPEKALTDTWLQQQKQHYQAQLHLYAIALAPQRDYPIQVALYFPRLSGWIAWKPEKEISSNILS